MQKEEIDRLAAVADRFERMQLGNYVEQMANRKRMILVNLLYGMMRGLGFMIGFSVLGAALLVVLQHLVVDNIPGIGGFLAEIVNAIQERR